MNIETNNQKLTNDQKYLYAININLQSLDNVADVYRANDKFEIFEDYYKTFLHLLLREFNELSSEARLEVQEIVDFFNKYRNIKVISYIIKNLNIKFSDKSFVNKINYAALNCKGCIEEQPNQQAHMEFGGCMEEQY
jgi:phosphotransferase system IIB component